MKAFAMAAMATVSLFPLITFAEESAEPVVNLTDTMVIMPVTAAPVDAPMMCTMEYAPVCWINGTTYWNSCMAGKNAVAYAGECDTYVDVTRLARLKRVAGKSVTAKVSSYTEEARYAALDLIEKRIETVKLSRIAPQAQKEKITFLVFVREMIRKSIASL